jgi:hypothetical protein
MFVFCILINCKVIKRTGPDSFRQKNDHQLLSTSAAATAHDQLALNLSIMISAVRISMVTGIVGITGLAVVPLWQRTDVVQNISWIFSRNSNSEQIDHQEVRNCIKACVSRRYYSENDRNLCIGDCYLSGNARDSKHE